MHKNIYVGHIYERHLRNNEPSMIIYYVTNTLESYYFIVRYMYVEHISCWILKFHAEGQGQIFLKPTTVNMTLFCMQS